KRNHQVPFEEDNYTHNTNKENERKLDRRSFMKTMVGAAGVLAVSTLPWGGIAAKELLGVGEQQHTEQLVALKSEMRIGEALEFAYPSSHDSALLIRLSANEFKAYQNACTHLKCPVFWDDKDTQLVCPCHHGFFNAATGAPTAGPPQRPLPEIVLKQQGD